MIPNPPDNTAADADPAVLVESNIGLVHRIARNLISHLAAGIQMDDLVQAGMLGLVEAARHFRGGQGARFETYAGIRIRGAMLDELRRYDWTPRSVHRKARAVAEAIREIEARTGRHAQDSEVARHLQIDLPEYQRILQDALYCQLFSIESLTESGDAALAACADSTKAPMECLQRAGFAEALTAAIAGLPEREHRVITLYYEEEMNLKEIGEVIGVGESRVCQIHSQAMLRLRARLHGWQDTTVDNGVGPVSRQGAKSRGGTR